MRQRRTRSIGAFLAGAPCQMQRIGRQRAFIFGRTPGRVKRSLDLVLIVA
jgi:hypothetical protein